MKHCKNHDVHVVHSHLERKVQDLLDTPVLDNNDQTEEDDIALEIGPELPTVTPPVVEIMSSRITNEATSSTNSNVVLPLLPAVLPKIRKRQSSSSSSSLPNKISKASLEELPTCCNCLHCEEKCTDVRCPTCNYYYCTLHNASHEVHNLHVLRLKYSEPIVVDYSIDSNAPMEISNGGSQEAQEDFLTPTCTSLHEILFNKQYEDKKFGKCICIILSNMSKSNSWRPNGKSKREIKPDYISIITDELNFSDYKTCFIKLFDEFELSTSIPVAYQTLDFGIKANREAILNELIPKIVLKLTLTAI